MDAERKYTPLDACAELEALAREYAGGTGRRTELTFRIIDKSYRIEWMITCDEKWRSDSSFPELCDLLISIVDDRYSDRVEQYLLPEEVADASVFYIMKPNTKKGWGKFYRRCRVIRALKGLQIHPDKVLKYLEAKGLEEITFSRAKLREIERLIWMAEQRGIDTAPLNLLAQAVETEAAP